MVKTNSWHAQIPGFPTYNKYLARYKAIDGLDYHNDKICVWIQLKCTLHFEEQPTSGSLLLTIDLLNKSVKI